MLSVDPEDVGRVIGRKGATAQAIRLLLRALGTKQDARYNLKIADVEGGESREPREFRAEQEEAEETEESEENASSELAEKTRAELADLDDLDI